MSTTYTHARECFTPDRGAPLPRPATRYSTAAELIDAIERAAAIAPEVATVHELGPFVDGPVKPAELVHFAYRVGEILGGLTCPNTRPRLAALAAQAAVEPAQVCERLFADYAYGLRLAGRNRYEIDLDTVEAPQKELDRLVRAAYSSRDQGPAAGAEAGTSP
jgi:hypothetical protein